MRRNRVSSGRTAPLDPRSPGLDPRSAPAAERNPAHDPRSSSKSPAQCPATGLELDERRPFVCQIGMQTPRSAPLEAQQPGDRPRIFCPFFVVFAQNCQKTAETGYRIWSEFSAKNRELAEIRQFCQKKLGPGCAIRVRCRTKSGARIAGSGRGPGISGQIHRPDLVIHRPRADARAAARRLLGPCFCQIIM